MTDILQGALGIENVLRIHTTRTTLALINFGVNN